MDGHWYQGTPVARRPNDSRENHPFRADEGIGPYGNAVESGGNRAGGHIGPPLQVLIWAAPATQAARSSCAAVGGSAAYGCGVPLAGKAERAEGGTSGTLVTEMLGAPQRETVKENLVKCVLAPQRPPHHPSRDGSCKLAEDYSVPEGQAKSEQAPIRRPPSRAEARRCRSAPSAFFSSTGRGAFSFLRSQKENGGRIGTSRHRG